MTKLRRNIWFLITIVFAVCVTAITLKYFVTDPWHCIGELGGDGAKNNFTYLYQSMYGSGYWFTGMNYPHGEHIVYTDGQPLLSVLLDHFKNVGPARALTIMWRLIDLSYVLAIIFIYLVLTHFRVGPFVAMVFAGLITVFSPQLFRIQGHYALAYTCIIPMIFYWMVLYHERVRYRYCVYIFIAGCLTAFLHLYYIAMMLIWVIGYSIGYFIFTKAALLQKVKHVLPLIVSIIGIFAVVGIVMKLTDPVKDRPVSPYNSFYETCTRLRQIITSAHSPVWEYAKSKRLVYTLAIGGEGYVYLGLVICFTIAFAAIAALIKSFREKKPDILVADSGFSPIWLFTALLALVIGMGIPFIWHTQWLDYLSVFRQFRSLGRFSWIFYHIIAVYSVIVIYHGYKILVAKRRFAAGVALLVFTIGLWSYEAKGYIDRSRYIASCAMYNYEMIFSESEQGWQSYLQDHNYKKDDFQAILSLPFYHVGTEKLWVGNSDWLNTLSTKAALQLHLPIVDVMMSRSSWSQAFKQVKIAAGPYADKPLLRDIPNGKPFLLLHFDEDTLNPDQKYLLSASDYIGHYSQCYVYACYPARIAANDKKNADSINAILPFMHGADTSIGSKGSWYIDHFDTGRANEKLFGAGAYACINQDSNLIATIPVKPVGDSQQFEFSSGSCWANKDPRSPDMLLYSLDSAGSIIDTTFVHTNKSVDNHGMWFRMSEYFYVHGRSRSLKCILLNKPGPSYKVMDEMMLRPADATIISKDAGGRVMVNNHLFKER